MAKKKTIFDDNRVAVQKLTNVIKQDIGHLNKQIGQLQTIAKYCNHSNTSSNSLIVSGLKERVKGSRRQAILPATSSILVQLQSKLATMSNNFKQVHKVIF